MALIKEENIKKLEKTRNTVHQPVESTYTVFENDGGKFFQIDTYGAPDRKMPEKISQSIQFDKRMAEYLIKLLKREFDI
ncbi:MAG: methionyl-tRNA formyltransferase [Clostridium lundense]|nr:methionyl-tRNA formyltransferase [Clostridium lundense]